MRKIKKVFSIIIMFAVLISTSSISIASNSASSENIKGVCPSGKNYCSATIRNEYDDCKEILISTTSNFNFNMYTVVDARTPVRKTPDKYSEIIGYLSNGDIIRNGCYITNRFGNRWLKYQTSNGYLYVYSSHLEDHVHDWLFWCSGTRGHVEKCIACNTGRIVIDNTGYVDCKNNVFCEIFCGDWSNTSSPISIIVNAALSNTPHVFVVPRTRDFL